MGTGTCGTIFRRKIVQRSTMQLSFYARAAGALILTAVAAFAGTVSSQIAKLAPGPRVDVIIQHTSTRGGGVAATVCGAGNVIEALPGGEHCSPPGRASITLPAPHTVAATPPPRVEVC